MKMLKKRFMSEAEAAREDPTTIQEILDTARGLLNLGSVLGARREEAWVVGSGATERVTVLDIGDNNLKEVPADLKTLGRLREADCSGNGLTEIPTCWRGVSGLKVNRNSITKITEEVLHLKSLKLLMLDHNDIDEIPGFLSKMTQLEVLSIMSNPRVKRLPEPSFFKGFGSLTLYLDNSVRLKQNWEEIKGVCPKVNVVWNSVYPDMIRPGLFLGSLRTAQNPHTYKELGVTHVLTCGKGLEVKIPDGVGQMKIDVMDCADENIMCHLEKAVGYISECVKQQGTVLVHCFAGISRSSTVCTAYLMTTESLTPSAALASIRTNHPVANPNAGFLSQLEAFHTLPRIPSFRSTSSSSSASSIGYDTPSPRGKLNRPGRSGTRPTFGKKPTPPN